MTQPCPICGTEPLSEPCHECNAELLLIGRVEILESGIMPPSIYGAEVWDGAECPS